MVVLVVLAYAVTLAGNGFDWQAALGGLKAAGLPALLLSLGRLVKALMDKIDEDDPMYYTMTSGRSVRPLGLWERVW